MLVLTSGATRAALVVLDLTSISAEAIAQIRQVVTKTAGVAATDIIVTVTHTFSAPHVLASTSSPGAATWVQNIVAAATSAAADAVKSARPARAGYGVGSADVNVNRNVETSAGWWLGTGEALPSATRRPASGRGGTPSTRPGTGPRPTRGTRAGCC